MAENIVSVGVFSKDKPGNELPLNWEPLTFKKIKNHTKYQLVKIDGKIVVKAITKNSASGLIRKIDLDLREYPIIEWHWKIDNIYIKGNAKEKSGDDYPGRIYIAFKYDSTKVGFFEKVKFNAIKAIFGEYPPVASINYIWERSLPVGTIVENPYTQRVQMIVVDTGKEKLGQWITHTRNVLDDYRVAFGEDPPHISGVAIMSDSDNTNESATAYYGDLIFKKN
ncbi:hypothetical protein MHK_007684, partial [Candidatus Magnetomorum sp. HK-1]